MKTVVDWKMIHSNAPGNQPPLTLVRGGETVCGETVKDAAVIQETLMEQVVERNNLFAALKRVTQNKGGAGIDGMSLKELPNHLKQHWPKYREQMLSGCYKPQAVKRVEIPKANGGMRQLGIPTVLDRFIQQALLQVLQPEWDRSFSHSSFGFRPNRSAHQAIERSQRYIAEDKRWVVDMDLEKFFDRVNHDVLMHRVKQRIGDKRVLKLINSYLKAGVMTDHGWQSSA